MSRILMLHLECVLRLSFWYRLSVILLLVVCMRACGVKHIPLFIAALLILLVGLVYTALLFSWKWLLHLPMWRIFRSSRNAKIHTFIEIYHTPYTPTYRYWTGLLLIICIILYLVDAINVSIYQLKWNCVIILYGPFSCIIIVTYVLLSSESELHNTILFTFHPYAVIGKTMHTWSTALQDSAVGTTSWLSRCIQ